MTENASDRAGILLRSATRLVAPLARLLVANGVTYTMFAQALKRVFLTAAERELESEGKRITDSALSLLSGVHRKDVRALTSDEPPQRRAITIASQVTMAWTTQPEYLDAQGRPIPLPMRSADPSSPSFERLAQGVSKDFHARSVLDELVRLGVAEEQSDGLSRIVAAGGFLPVHDLEELARQLSANVGDHLAASAANFGAVHKGAAPPFLEYALWADELSAGSVAELQRLAKDKWLEAMKAVRNRAEQLSERDRQAGAAADLHRLRFGVYVFHERGFEPLAGDPQAPAGDEQSKAKDTP